MQTQAVRWLHLPPNKTWRNQPVNSKSLWLQSTFGAPSPDKNTWFPFSGESPSCYSWDDLQLPNPPLCPCAPSPSLFSMAWLQILASLFSECLPICTNPLKHGRHRGGHWFSDPSDGLTKAKPMTWYQCCWEHSQGWFCCLRWNSRDSSCLMMSVSSAGSPTASCPAKPAPCSHTSEPQFRISPLLASSGINKCQLLGSGMNRAALCVVLLLCSPQSGGNHSEHSWGEGGAGIRCSLLPCCRNQVVPWVQDSEVTPQWPWLSRAFFVRERSAAKNISRADFLFLWGMFTLELSAPLRASSQSPVTICDLKGAGLPEGTNSFLSSHRKKLSCFLTCLGHAPQAGYGTETWDAISCPRTGHCPAELISPLRCDPTLPS